MQNFSEFFIFVHWRNMDLSVTTYEVHWLFNTFLNTSFESSQKIHTICNYVLTLQASVTDSLNFVLEILGVTRLYFMLYVVRFNKR